MRLYFSLFLCLMTVSPIGCSKKSGVSTAPLTSDALLRDIKLKAEQLDKAYWDGDGRKMAELTHPSLIQKVGGQEKFIELSQRERAEGLTLESQQLEAPQEVIVGGADWYAIVPTTQNMTLSGKRFTLTSFWIAVSSDKGKTWTFVHSSHLDNTPLHQLLPNFPANLKLPERQKPVW